MYVCRKKNAHIQTTNLLNYYIHNSLKVSPLPSPLSVCVYTDTHIPAAYIPVHLEVTGHLGIPSSKATHFAFYKLGSPTGLELAESAKLSV